MIIRAGFSISFTCTAPTPMLLLLNVRPEREADLLAPENFRAFPEVPLRRYQDRFGNTCTRLVAPVGQITFTNDFLIEDSGLHELLPIGAPEAPVDSLPDDILMYLMGSRYCDTQRLMTIAWELFGNVAPGWARVEAILNYTHNHLTFGYGYARNDRTAFDAYAERVGVCRDFAHLAITLCRCMNIPARYCTGYLGDIGVPADPNPMDFSAWFEVYLGGAWHTLDARHNEPRIGRILVARGMDATDTAISMAFGSANLSEFTVVTEEASDQQTGFQSADNSVSTSLGVAS
ncbi:transglutaminase-like putative cysteine protease [Rhizomicrobium palustre]|uniref:Transglutaminase-like putative cysteine protease n=1 Tax=Rhizomicrobium palustre TaxID=189966 RepID=A0A846MZQ7_9PROT|nr:transglutaminase family protein [Rhizomicrobium palustre]NIK88492.1 transglutaminase-like putative cysteine protease [Rhizomicrobium palustre]